MLHAIARSNAGSIQKWVFKPKSRSEGKEKLLIKAEVSEQPRIHFITFTGNMTVMRNSGCSPTCLFLLLASPGCFTRPLVYVIPPCTCASAAVAASHFRLRGEDLQNLVSWECNYKQTLNTFNLPSSQQEQNTSSSVSSLFLLSFPAMLMSYIINFSGNWLLVVPLN